MRAANLEHHSNACQHSGRRQATLTSRRTFRVPLRSAHLKRAESSSSWVFSRLCRGKPSHTVLDALTSTMLTVIVGMTRDERQRLRSLQTPVAIRSVGVHCGIGSISRWLRGPATHGVAVWRQPNRVGGRCCPATLPPTPNPRHKRHTATRFAKRTGRRRSRGQVKRL